MRRNWLVAAILLTLAAATPVAAKGSLQLFIDDHTTMEQLAYVTGVLDVVRDFGAVTCPPSVTPGLIVTELRLWREDNPDEAKRTTAYEEIWIVLADLGCKAVPAKQAKPSA